MKKIILMFIFSVGCLFLTSCGKSTTTTTKEQYGTIVQNISDVHIEVDETYTFQYIVNSNQGLVISTLDENIVSVNNDILTGVSVGETNVLFEKNGIKQLVPVKVYEKGALSLTFSFSKERLAGKKIVAFGDSVTSNATVGGGRTYFDNFATAFAMNKGKNYAIGGTTGTYMYEGSNIYKEYAGSTTAIDGVRTVKKAYDNNELNDVDYVFIAYGHNDQYFQAPISANGDDVYDINSFDSCHSFKGSYRYMINTLKLANPNVRIILLNCTYSEYDRSNPSIYGRTYSYNDYRTAISEVAEEFSLTHIDPWDFLYLFFDAYSNKVFYKDPVHLSLEGHVQLGEYIRTYREQ